MIERSNHGRGHTYKIDGARVPGVTTILRVLPKDNLIGWAADAAARCAVDEWNDLSRIPVSERIKRIAGAPNRNRDAAGNRGTQVHKLGERLVAHERVDVPEELAGHVESYVDFLNTCDPRPVLVEGVIGSRTLRYCGTLDLVADLGSTRWLLDLKTARSGIWGETALQEVAYSRADVYLDADGVEHPMGELGIERLGAVWVRADGWDLYPVDGDVDEAWSIFRHLRWLHDHVEYLSELVGPSVDVPRRVAS